MSRIKITLISLLAMFVILSCGLPTISQPVSPTTDPAVLVAQALAQTQQMQTQIAMAAQLTMAASGGGALPPPPAALPTYTFQPTYTIQLTNTPSTVTVTVSVNTNCRTGPGDDYPIVGALTVGQTAEVIGKSRGGDNWIVKLPGKTSTCWLWGYYATVTGNTAGLPFFDPPPIPATKTNTASPFINITMVNNSGGDVICYVWISGSDDPDWGSNELPGTINPGGSYTWYSYVPDVYDVRAEDCWNNVLKYWWGVSMYVNTWLYYP